MAWIGAWCRYQAPIWGLMEIREYRRFRLIEIKTNFKEDTIGKTQKRI